MVIVDGITYEYKRLNRFVQLATALLHKPESSFKHFSFIVKGTRIYSVGWNSTTKPGAMIDGHRFIYPRGGAHSEADSISNLSDLNICRKGTMVNIRLNKRGQLRNSRPCYICQKIIESVGFNRVYYSTDSGFEMLYI